MGIQVGAFLLLKIWISIIILLLTIIIILILVKDITRNTNTLIRKCSKWEKSWPQQANYVNFSPVRIFLHFCCLCLFVLAFLLLALCAACACIYPLTTWSGYVAPIGTLHVTIRYKKYAKHMLQFSLAQKLNNQNSHFELSHQCKSKQLLHCCYQHHHQHDCHPLMVIDILNPYSWSWSFGLLLDKPKCWL